MRSLALAAVLLLAAAPAAAQANCVGCHVGLVEARLRAPTDPVPADAHGAAGVDCVSCHGGDPEATTAAAHDLAGGFVGRPGDAGSARMCGRCHDGTTEAPATLEAWRDGRHARALAEGRDGAGCASCHGGHGIGGATHRAAVVGTCATCHSDEERMAPSGLPTDQAREWARSVHGAAVAAGSERAPVCASCHDPHRNAAGLAAVGACGGCHEAVRRAFDGGPHADHFAPLGFLDCVECHGSHEVERPAAAMLTGLETVCGRCHGREQRVFRTVRRIGALGHAIDRLRALESPEAYRRGAVIDAVHALDADALQAALEGVPREPPAPPAAPPPPRLEPAPPPAGPSLALTAAGVLSALFAFALLATLGRRR